MVALHASCFQPGVPKRDPGVVGVAKLIRSVSNAGTCSVSVFVGYARIVPPRQVTANCCFAVSPRRHPSPLRLRCNYLHAPCQHSYRAPPQNYVHSMRQFRVIARPHSLAETNCRRKATRCLNRTVLELRTSWRTAAREAAWSGCLELPQRLRP